MAGAGCNQARANGKTPRRSGDLPHHPMPSSLLCKIAMPRPSRSLSVPCTLMSKRRDQIIPKSPVRSTIWQFSLWNRGNTVQCLVEYTVR